MDLSQMPDDQLMKIAGGASTLSDDELMRIAGVQEEPSAAGQFMQNAEQGVSDLADLVSFAPYQDVKSMPASQKLKQKYDAGTATTQDYLEAFFEGGANSPAGRALSAINIHPGINAVSTAFQKYINPAVENVTGASPEEVQAVEMALPFAGKVISKVAPKTSEAIMSGAKKVINAPLSQPVTQTAGRAMSPKIAPEDVGLLQKAQDIGYPVLRSQMGESDIASGLQNMNARTPFSGMGKVAKEQQSVLNREVSKSFGADSNKLTAPVMKKAYDNIGKEYDALFKNTKLKISDERLQSLFDAESTAIDDGVTIPPVLKKNITKLLNYTKGDEIKGEVVGNVRKDLSSFVRRMPKHEAAPYAKAVLNVITDIAEDSGNKGLLEANKKYKNYQIAKKALDAKTFDINPNKLQKAVQKNFSDYERGGGGRLGELSQISSRYQVNPPANAWSPDTFTNVLKTLNILPARALTAMDAARGASKDLGQQGLLSKFIRGER